MRDKPYFDSTLNRSRAGRVGETVIADSRNTQLLTEGNLPAPLFPREDVAMKFLVASASVTHCPHKGDALLGH